MHINAPKISFNHQFCTFFSIKTTYKNSIKNSLNRLNNDEPICLDWEFDVLSYQSCKSTCNSNGCNSKTPQRTNSCHNCEVIVNHLGNVVGTGDINCFENPTDDMLVDCGVGGTCRTELAVELSFSGYQVTKVTRECSPKGKVTKSLN